MAVFKVLNEQHKIYVFPSQIFLANILIFSITLVMLFFCISNYLVSNNFPIELTFILAGVIGIIPLFWLFTFNRHRLCLTLSTVALLLGDFSPALISPLIVVLTLSNFIYLIYKNRNSKIRYFLLPFLLLAALYFENSFLWGFLDVPIMVTNGKIIELGWMGSLGGGVIVYHILYLFLAIYHITCSDKNYLKCYMIILSIIINLIVIIGLIQFGSGLFTLGEAYFRIPSIMRITTRLAPFIVTSLSLIILNLLEKPPWKERIYWVLSLVLSIVLLLITQTRGAIFGGGILLTFLTLGFIRSYRNYRLLIISGSVLFLTIVISFYIFQENTIYLQRFTPEMLMQGIEKRTHLWEQFWQSIDYQNTSILRNMVHLLFGYGWFAERFYVYPHNMDAHNTFLSLFTTYGLIGSFLYFYPLLNLLLMSLKNTFNDPITNSRPYYAMTAGLIIVYLVTGFVHNKLYSPIESAYMWIMIGLLLKNNMAQIFPASSSQLS